MITSGLVITLSADATLAARAVARVSARVEFTPGERNARWLPVAMEAEDDAHARELHDWIGAQPGVEFVDVVSVSFDDSERGGGEDQPQPVETSALLRRVEDDAAALHPVPFSALND